MKKLITCILIIATVISLFSCVNRNDETTFGDIVLMVGEEEEYLSVTEDAITIPDYFLQYSKNRFTKPEMIGEKRDISMYGLNYTVEYVCSYENENYYGNVLDRYVFENESGIFTVYYNEYDEIVIFVSQQEPPFIIDISDFSEKDDLAKIMVNELGEELDLRKYSSYKVYAELVEEEDHYKLRDVINIVDFFDTYCDCPISYRKTTVWFERNGKITRIDKYDKDIEWLNNKNSDPSTWEGPDYETALSQAETYLKEKLPGIKKYRFTNCEIQKLNDQPYYRFTINSEQIYHSFYIFVKIHCKTDHE